MSAFITQMLSEANGSPSSMRGFVALIVAGLILKNIFLSVITKGNVPFDQNEVLLILGAMGIKVLQKGKEAPEVTPEVVK